MPVPPVPTVQQLADFIESAFDLRELKWLCFHLGVKYDNVAGDTLSVKVLELALYLERRGRLAQLEEVLACQRPEPYRAWVRQHLADNDLIKDLDALFSQAIQLRAEKKLCQALQRLQLIEEIEPAYPRIASEIEDTKLKMRQRSAPLARKRRRVLAVGVLTVVALLAIVVGATLILRPRAGDIRTVMRGDVAIEQVYVPAGSFMMGSKDGNEDERPAHEVTLDAFWIDRTEVTNAQFAAFVADTGYKTISEREGGSYIYTETGAWELVEGADWQHPQGPNSNLDGLETHPVVQVSWDDATAYASWAGGRLPTEAEWEYAARGPQSFTYPWGNLFSGEKLNFCDRNCPFDWANQSVDDGYQFTAPVGSYPVGASWVGALDISGNVWELVYDWYDSSYYEHSPSINPSGPEVGDNKVLRGGSWIDDQVTRAARRRNHYSTNAVEDIGFRVVEPLSDSDS